MLRGFFRRLFFSFSFLFLLSINHIDYVSPVPIGDHPLLAGWEVTGLPAGEMEIEGWKKCSDQFLSPAVLRAKAEALRRQLRLKTAGPLYSGEEQGFNFVNLDGFLPDGSRVVVTLQSVRRDDGEGETHCGLMGFAAPVSNLRRYLRRLERALAPAAGEFPFKVALRGRRPGRLSEDEAAELMKKMLARLQADLVSGGPAGAAGRWLARSPYLGAEIKTETGGANLEFVYRYDDRENNTQLILGTPLIPYGF